MKIGIFDSGMGGLCVLHCASNLLPEAELLYYADEQHVPYGDKVPEVVQGYVKDILQFMLTKNVDAIVIACNTATSLVGRRYRDKFPIPIIGMEPALKLAMDLYASEQKRILVAATPITINGTKLHNLVEQVDPHHMADLIALPDLVRFAEKGNYTGDEVITYLKNAFTSMNLEAYGTVVLGCTHFNYFKESFLKLFPNPIHFVDGNVGTIHQVMRLLSIPFEGDNFKEKRITDDIMNATSFYISGKNASKEELSSIRLRLSLLDKMYQI